MTSRRLRLGEHVLARRHVIEGRECVVLHDTARERLYALEPHQFTVLAMADGTRDAEGIVAAVSRYGVHLGADAVARFLAELDGEGLCEAGPAPHHPEATELGRDLVDLPPDDPVVPLPGYRFQCHGHGGCCRRYETIVCTPDDVARARAALPGHRCGPVPIERLFLPVRGAAPSPLFTPTLRNGACCFLGDDDLCDIHRAAGAAAKPLGCAAFPVVAFYDGLRVHLSVSTECGCVFDSVGRDEGDPLMPGHVQRVADLPPTFAVARLPERVRLAEHRIATAEQARGWLERGLAEPWLEDVPTRLWAMAEGLEQGSPLDDAFPEPCDPFATPQLGRWFAALHDTITTWAGIETRWRAADDHVRMAGSRLLEAMAALGRSLVAGALPTASKPTDERFHVQANLSAGRVFGKHPLATALRDLAVRQWLAREIDPSGDPAFAHPLAVVDACMRGHGLDRYLGRLED